MKQWLPVLVRIIESQNHRKVEAGRHLWRLFRLKPLLKQGQLEQIAQDCVLLSFEYLHGWRLHNFLWQPVLVFGYSHNKKVVSYV